MTPCSLMEKANISVANCICFNTKYNDKFLNNRFHLQYIALYFKISRACQLML
jgi:hypothetical protein